MAFSVNAGVLLGVLITRALLFGVCFPGPDFWKLPGKSAAKAGKVQRLQAPPFLGIRICSSLCQEPTNDMQPWLICRPSYTCLYDYLKAICGRSCCSMGHDIGISSARHFRNIKVSTMTVSVPPTIPELTLRPL